MYSQSTSTLSRHLSNSDTGSCGPYLQCYLCNNPMPVCPITKGRRKENGSKSGICSKRRIIRTTNNTCSLILAPYGCQPISCSHVFKRSGLPVLFLSSSAGKNKVPLVQLRCRTAQSNAPTATQTETFHFIQETNLDNRF